MLPFVAIILALIALRAALVPAAGAVHPLRPRRPMSAAEPAPDAPLENRTLREQVLDHLREEILASRLAPGTELGEVALARSLGDQPRAAARGDRTARRRGPGDDACRAAAPSSRALTRQEFLDAYQVREALESLAIRLAVPRLTRRRAGRAARACATRWSAHAAAGDDERASSRSTRAFHRLLVRGLGQRASSRRVHAQLIGQMGRLTEQVGRAARRPRAVGGRAPRRSSRAIDAGDADAGRRGCSRSTSRCPSASSTAGRARDLRGRRLDQPRDEEWRPMAESTQTADSSSAST